MVATLQPSVIVEISETTTTKTLKLNKKRPYKTMTLIACSQILSFIAISILMCNEPPSNNNNSTTSNKNIELLYSTPKTKEFVSIYILLFNGIVTLFLINISHNYQYIIGILKAMYKLSYVAYMAAITMICFYEIFKGYFMLHGDKEITLNRSDIIFVSLWSVISGTNVLLCFFQYDMVIKDYYQNY